MLMGDEKETWKVKTLDEILLEKKRRRELEEKTDPKRQKNVMYISTTWLLHIYEQKHALYYPSFFNRKNVHIVFKHNKLNITFVAFVVIMSLDECIWRHFNGLFLFIYLFLAQSSQGLVAQADDREAKRDTPEEGELRDQRMEITIRNSPYTREDSTEDR